MAKKPGFTIEQHEALGCALQTMRDNLSTITEEVCKAYPGPFGDIAFAVEDAAEDLAGILQERVNADFPAVAGVQQIYWRRNRPDYEKSAFARDFSTGRPRLAILKAHQEAAASDHEFLSEYRRGVADCRRDMVQQLALTVNLIVAQHGCQAADMTERQQGFQAGIEQAACMVAGFITTAIEQDAQQKVVA